MTYPYLTIDLDTIEHNAREIAGLCAGHGVTPVGVTKVVCGHPEVARAMLQGGIAALADSRLENLRRLRAAGLDVPLMLLRVPPLSGADEVVTVADCSLNSEWEVLQALSAAAEKQGRIHEVLLMVDVGERREGVLPGDVLPLTQEIVTLPGIRLMGLGTNLACFAGVIPSERNLGELTRLAEAVERACRVSLPWVSGINSSGLHLLAAGRTPPRINHARIGEAIVLGRETTSRQPWPGTHQDAFVLHGEILELKRKPAAPEGELGEDAFGHHPQFRADGESLRALLNIGREDADLEGLTPCDPRHTILGGTSGYLVVDIGESAKELRVGDELNFLPNYSALLAAMTSEYVKKRPIRHAEPHR